MTKSVNPRETATGDRAIGSGFIQGHEIARKLARTGRIISAIKLLELMNPKISRQHAKTVVNSFGYSSNPSWPQDDIQPVRCL